MNLITVFRDRDGIVEEFDEKDTTTVAIQGNRLTVYDSDGKVVGRATLELDHNVPVWRLFKGARGKEIGVVTGMQFYV